MKDLTTITPEIKKVKKERKAITIKLSAIVLVAISLAIGAFLGVVINNAINQHINAQVQEQVTVFTEAQE